jgi:hypothetical protein
MADALHYSDLFESWAGSIALHLQAFFSDGTEQTAWAGS